REDIGHLVATLIARHDKGGPPRTLSRTAASALFAYPWPLNIRELEQCLSAALTVAGPEISVEHLPRPIRDAETAPRSASASQREQLVAIIQKHGGNLSAVAREPAPPPPPLPPPPPPRARRPPDIRAAPLPRPSQLPVHRD